MVRIKEGLECATRKSKVKEFHQKAPDLLNLYLPTSPPSMVRGSSRISLGDLWAVFSGQEIEKTDA